MVCFRINVLHLVNGAIRIQAVEDGVPSRAGAGVPSRAGVGVPSQAGVGVPSRIPRGALEGGVRILTREVGVRLPPAPKYKRTIFHQRLRQHLM